MPEHIDTLSDLISRLPKAYNAPSQDLITIRVGNDFEPHGCASETWETIYTLTLNTIPHHWLSTTGWRLGETSEAIRFSGRTLSDVVDKAARFLEWFLREGEGSHG
jgi:hypothetical protein